MDARERFLATMTFGNPDLWEPRAYWKPNSNPSRRCGPPTWPFRQNKKKGVNPADQHPVVMALTYSDESLFGSRAWLKARR